MSEPTRLAADIARCARSLPPDQVELLAQAVEHGGGADPGHTRALSSLVPTTPFRTVVGALLQAWEKAGDVDGRAVALALRAASQASAGARADQHVEVVWTGPEGHVDVRLTYAVLRQVVRVARRRLTLVSFAAYKVGMVAEELRRAADGGVDVRLVLDGGTDAGKAFATLGAAAQVYTWPPTLLDPHHPDHASLHAKAALADDQVAFVTSANLTGHGLDRNIELGLLVRGGSVPRQLAAHFDGLISDKVLVPLDEAERRLGGRPAG